MVEPSERFWEEDGGASERFCEEDGGASERLWEEDGGASERFWEEDGGAIQACSEGLSIATPLDLSPNSDSIAERCQPVLADVRCGSSRWYRSAIEEGFISSRGVSLRLTPRYRLVSLRDELEHFN